MAAVKVNPRSLIYAHEDLKKNKRIVLEAYKGDKVAITYADASLRQSIEGPFLAKQERMLIRNRKRFSKNK